MAKGLLVYDKADAEYNRWFIEKIISTGADMGLDISLVLTEDIGFDLDDVSFAIMRNRNVKMSECLENMGIRCFNSSYVCKIGNDKWEMYRDFSAAGIPVMYTQKAKLPFPFVLKPRDGHGGQNVFLVNNAEEYENAKALIEIKRDSEIPDNCYFKSVSSDSCSLCESDRTESENQNNETTAFENQNEQVMAGENYIYQMKASETGRDIRVYVCGDVILTAIERVAADEKEFRANFSLGGKASEHALTDDELKLAAKVADRIKPDLVGIDIIYNNGKPVVNEIEDAVGTRMLYANTDIDAVEEYMKWIKKCLDGI